MRKRWILLAAAGAAGAVALVLHFGGDRNAVRATGERKTPSGDEQRRPHGDAPADAKTEEKHQEPGAAASYPPKPTISGQVVDADTGAAIPQAHVFVLLKGASVAQGLSDRTGRFAIGGLDADVQYEMDATADGYTSALLTAAAANDGDRRATPGDDVQIRLGRGLRIAGRVEDSVGHPLAGALVENKAVQFKNGGIREFFVGGRVSSISVRTDGHGRFDISGAVPVGKSYFQVKLDGYEDGQFQIEGASWKPDDEVVVKLLPVRRLAGHVLGPDGRPRGGVGVFAVRYRHAEKPVLTRDDGGFEIDWRKGSAAVVAWGEGLLPRIVVVAEDEAGPVEFRLTRALAVRGAVVDDLERPVAGVRVRLHHYRMLHGGEPRILASAFLSQLSWSEDDVKWGLLPSAGEDLLPGTETTTDDLGRFTLLVGGRGEIGTTLLLERDGHATTQAKWSKQPEEQLFRLPRVARVTLRAIDAGTGQARPDFRVLYRVVGASSARGRTNEGQGRPLVLSLAAGRYQFEVTAKGYRKKVTDPVHLEPGSERTIEVPLQPQ